MHSFFQICIQTYVMAANPPTKMACRTTLTEMLSTVCQVFQESMVKIYLYKFYFSLMCFYHLCQNPCKKKTSGLKSFRSVLCLMFFDHIACF